MKAFSPKVRRTPYGEPIRTIICLFVAIIAALPQTAVGGVIQGAVINRESQQPLVGANVMLLSTVLGTSTDGQGRFLIGRVPQGTYSLAVSMLGYERKVAQSIEVVEEETVDVLVELTPSAIQTEPVVVTASRREQSLKEIPVSVSILDTRELSYRNAVTIDEALRYVPGVNMTQGQVNVRGSTGYSRGVGTRVLVLVDGLPLLSGDTGEIIWESLPVYQVDRIEIVKGAGSALYGSSALGGVINILSKNITDLPETRARAYAGVYETPKYPKWRWTDESRYLNGIYASHAQRFGSWSMFAGGSRAGDEGFKKNDSWRRYNGSLRVAYDASPFESVGALFTILDQQRGNFLFWKSLDSALVPTDDQLGQQVQSTRWNLGAGYKRLASHNAHYMVKGSWYHTRWEDNIDTNRSISDAVNAEVQGTYLLGSDHTLTFGLYGSYNRVSAERIFGRHLGYGLAAYAQDEIVVAQELRFVLGARYDMHRLEGAEAVGQFNPKFGVTYNPADHTTVRFSVGRGFRAPSVAEVYTTTEASGVTVLPNPDLRAERSWSYEVGITQSIEGAVLAQLSIFQNDFWDLIEPTFSTDGKVRFQNVTRARVQGFEVSVNSSFIDDHIGAELGYTYMYPRDVTSQDILRYRPRHLLYTSGRFTLGFVQLGVDYRYLSRVEQVDDEFVVFGIIIQGDKRVPISVADVRLTADWAFAGLPFISSFHVNNLFGYHYVELIGNIAPIRHYVVTLEAKF